MPRKINPSWERAAYVASLMDNITDANIKRVMKELKEVRPDAEKLGYDDDDVVSCWEWIRTREDFPIDQARITTVLKGSPAYLVQWSAHMAESMPPVVFTAEFDDWVRQNAAWLRKRKWRYSWPSEISKSDNSRMTYSEAKELGLVEE